MGKKTKILMPVFAILLVVVFWMTAKTSFAMSTAPGIYHFFGRVINQEDKPVGRCSLLLIKRMAQKEEKQKTEAGQTEEKQYVVVNEEVVATTDEDGNYAFVFEPLSADNFWVFFKADGYRTRSMELNSLMRSRFFSKPNKTPIKLDVVLEKN
jgi:hypothetical protein